MHADAESQSEPGAVLAAVTRRSHDSACSIERALAIEAPVSLEFNGLAYAVMMATPVDLEDFGTGFAIAEGVIARPEELLDISAFEAELGWIVRMEISRDRIMPLRDRIRHRVADGGCGLCGLDNLESVMRPLPMAQLGPKLGSDAIFRSLSALRERQKLNAATGAVHAAAMCTPTGDIVELREDVGRHNAFDKLIGSLVRQGRSSADGFALLSSRCSYELVEKAIIAGFSTLVTISAPTSLATARAQESGLALVALARADAFLIVNDPSARLT